MFAEALNRLPVCPLKTGFGTYKHSTAYTSSKNSIRKRYVRTPMLVGLLILRVHCKVVRSRALSHGLGSPKRKLWQAPSMPANPASPPPPRPFWSPSACRLWPAPGQPTDPLLTPQAPGLNPRGSADLSARPALRTRSRLWTSTMFGRFRQPLTRLRQLKCSLTQAAGRI